MEVRLGGRVPLVLRGGAGPGVARIKKPACGRLLGDGPGLFLANRNRLQQVVHKHWDLMGEACADVSFVPPGNALPGEALLEVAIDYLSWPMLHSGNAKVSRLAADQAAGL